MPFEIIINTDHKVVFSFGLGTLTFADVVSHRSHLSQNARFRIDFGQILDLTHVTSMELSSDQISMLAKERVFASESRRAIIATSAFHYGLSRMFQTYSVTQNISVFRQPNEALDWVGVPLGVAETVFSEFRSLHGL